MTTFLSQLKWRFATKQFDPEKKVAAEPLQKILDAIRYAPSSMGMQPFKVFVITDQNLKQKLYPVSSNQPQVTSCSHLLVFCARTDLQKRTEEYVYTAIEGKTEQELRDIIDSRSGFIKRKQAEGAINWAARQTYIALGFGLAACAELQIDSCPMEGFDHDAVDKVLGLPPDIKSLAYLAIGYRQEGPKREKFRFNQDNLFENI